jgi:hypothetical protein
MTRSGNIGLTALVLVTLVGAGCGGSSDAGASSTQAATTGATGPHTVTNASPDARYSLAATRRCLIAAGFRVGRIGKPNSRLQALGDLAQRTSLAARRDGHVVGLALGDTELLSDLLAVPNDPYVLVAHGNALLLYAPTARREAAAVRACLKP